MLSITRLANVNAITETSRHCNRLTPGGVDAHSSQHTTRVGYATNPTVLTQPHQREMMPTKALPGGRPVMLRIESLKSTLYSKVQRIPFHSSARSLCAKGFFGVGLFRKVIHGS